MSYRFWLSAGIMIAAVLSDGVDSARAQDSAGELRLTVENILADSQRLAQASEQGKRRAALCKYCHGPRGTSVKPHVPNLAGQNPVYLALQFEKFASGERSDYVMTPLANNMTRSDRINLSIYFSRQDVASSHESDPELATRGSVVYDARCESCHGREALGQQQMPRLASQPREYLTQALRAFREDNPSRAPSPMQEVAADLSDEDLKAVVAYLAGL